MERQEAAPRASAPDVRLPGGPGRRESTRGCQAAAGDESKIGAVREGTFDARRVSWTRSDRSREVPPPSLRETPDAARGVSPALVLARLQIQQTTLTLDPAKVNGVTAPAPRASPARPGTSARAQGPSSSNPKGTACLAAREDASPDESCAPPPASSV